MAKLNFGGVEENVVTREEFPLAKAQQVLKNETVAVIGYGVQGPGQALNQKDNGINVIVGQRKNSKTWDKAVRDGFVPGETLFEIEEALQRGTIICYLLSDAAQIQLWPTVQKHLQQAFDFRDEGFSPSCPPATFRSRAILSTPLPVFRGNPADCCCR